MQSKTQVSTMMYDIRKDKDLRAAMLNIYRQAAAEFWAIRYEQRMGLLINPHEWRDVKACMSTTHQFLRQHAKHSSRKLKAIAKREAVR